MGGEVHPENFPRLTAANFKITSPATSSYNCIAWTLGDTSTWWSSVPGYYWPRVPKPMTVLANVITLYEQHGFEKCETDALEVGTEKVALFGTATRFHHAAQQLADGRWTSKLGRHEDIEHDTLDALSDGEYGTVLQIVRRRSQQ